MTALPPFFFHFALLSILFPLLRTGEHVPVVDAIIFAGSRTSFPVRNDGNHEGRAERHDGGGLDGGGLDGEGFDGEGLIQPSDI